MMADDGDEGCKAPSYHCVQCDETEPTCNQCAKSRRVCPGYKDDFDLVLRNETEATEQRARKAYNKALTQKTRKASSGEKLIRRAPIRSAESSNSFSPIASPIEPIEERSAHHLVSNYVLNPPQGTERGYFQFVVPLIRAEHPSPHFKLAFEACALAYFSNRMGSTAHLAKDALHKYVNALAKTGRAIQDPTESKQDATVAAVLLLGLFENITARHSGMLAWSSHIEGAIKLVQNRGREQLNTSLGRDIFVTVRTQQIIHSFSSGQHAARDVNFWINGAVKDAYATDLQRITLQISVLKTEINRLLLSLNRTPENIEIIMQAIQKCHIKDDELLQWAKNLPEYYHVRTVTWIDDVPDGDYSRAEVFPGRVDACQELWIASVWMMMRCSRLVLGSIIVRAIAWACSPADYHMTPEYSTWSSICASVITDLGSILPYQLGWFNFRKELLERADLTSYCCGDDTAAKGLSGSFIVWPLSCIITQDYSTTSQREWAKGRLEYVATDLGIRYAKMLIAVNVRVPSMLIKRDTQATSGSVNTATDNFEKILYKRIAPPSGLAMDYSQKRE
ncbi:hypothetical protein NLG97_g6010 [Lecanicillium saksenae]|uniref:Uncharacterized protein n=1 Tax=Lecanicillium saksenae TaxID=468837 RepID=A0ACC1QS06_9HYPO|nr:hypothetical protein NLG97_g6010 [Lecanicillium saksenae]